MRRILVLVAATAAFGCGGGDEGTARGNGATARSTPAATATPGATATPAATASPRSGAAPAPRPGLRLRRIGTFASPVYLTAPPGDRRRQFVVEQGGRVMVVRGGRTLRRPFLDIRDRVASGGERGLLSIAFAPDYARSGRFYASYTDTAGDSRIVEYRRASRNRADHGSARLVLHQDQPERNHNGGLILFGPDDRLYVGFGDGGGGGDRHGARGNAQDLTTLLGKILRIDPRRRGGRAYRVPRDNPFRGRQGRNEIFAYGVRNPWRFAFDPRTGNLVVGDVGENEVEEVTIVRRPGANLGWRPFEGRRRFTAGESAPGHRRPAIQRLHSNGNCSIVGGVVVRDRILAALRGRYVFGDLCTGRIESARLRGGRARGVRRTRLTVDGLASFGEDGRGRVYALALGGAVYRLVPRG